MISSLSTPAQAEASPLNRVGLVLAATVCFPLAARPAEVLFRAATLPGAPVPTPGDVASVAAFSLIGLGLLGLAALPELGARLARLALVMMVGLALIPGVLAAGSGGIYGVDSAAHTRYVAQLLLEGRHPYADFDVHEALDRFPVTPTSVTYNTDGSILSAYSYPAGAFLTVLPFQALGIDVRLVYEAAAAALVLLLAFTAPPGLRLLALGFAVQYRLLSAWTSGAGIGEPYWMVYVMAAYLLRHRTTASGLVMGLALTVKQLSWFFLPVYLIAQWHQGGGRAVIKSGWLAAAVFLVTNLPFFVTAPQDWLEGVLGPMLFPLPVLGFGLARLGAVIAPELPKNLYTVLEVLAMGGVAAAYWKWGRRYPVLALVLPWLPLWFAWRSLSSYFYLLPLALLAGGCALDWQRRRAAAAEGAPWLTADRVGLLAIAMLGLSLASGYEAGLLMDDLSGNSAAQAARSLRATLGAVVSALAIAQMVAAAAAPIGPRVRLLAVSCAMTCFCLLTLAGVFAPQAHRVDTTASIGYAAVSLLRGENPYATFDRAAAMRQAKDPDRPMGDTSGAPNDRYTLPAGSFLAAAPFAAAGVNDQRFVAALFQLALLLVLFVLAPPPLKLLTLAVSLVAFLPVPVDSRQLLFPTTGAGASDTLWPLMLLAARALWGRPAVAGILLGLAAAISQVAWWAAPFFAVAAWHGGGRRPAGTLLGATLGVFAGVNLPFAMGDPAAWMAGVLNLPLTPMPMGLGVAQLFAQQGGGSGIPLLVAQALTLTGLLGAYWRWGRHAPALALVLPWVPLWFAWHSGYAHLFALPLLLTGGLLLAWRATTDVRAATSAAAPAPAPVVASFSR